MQQNDRTKKRALAGFLVFTVLAAVLVLVVPWKPRADFDVVGILWIMQNIVPFAVLCVLIAGALGPALRCSNAKFAKPASNQKLTG